MKFFVEKIQQKFQRAWPRLRAELVKRRSVETIGQKQLKSIGLVLFVCLTLYVASLTLPPATFDPHTRIIIPDGSTLSDTAELLDQYGAIRSPFMFQILVHLRDGEHNLQAGTYTFPRRLSVSGVVDAVTTGRYQVPPTRITVFEGMRVEQIADILAHEHDIDRDAFIALAKEHEGYLFPDTYFIPDAYTASDILDLMQDTHEERIEPLRPQIAESGLTEEEVVIFASILEREARSRQSMRTVAGILQKRMELEMPLQVDAPFEYILDKSSADLTYSDLEVDSPYNTYKYTGLPPTPIANPGLQAIEAVLDPIETDYLFYLTAPDGTFHYSRTYEEHAYKQDLYL